MHRLLHLSQQPGLSDARLQWKASASFGGKWGRQTYKSPSLSLYSTQPVQNIDQVAARYLLLAVLSLRSGGEEKRDASISSVVDQWKSWSIYRVNRTFLIALIGCRQGKLNSTWHVQQLLRLQKHVLEILLSCSFVIGLCCKTDGRSKRLLHISLNQSFFMSSTLLTLGAVHSIHSKKH